MQVDNSKNRTYAISESVIFAKTSEEFGGLSNMAPGYPLYINENIIPNSEALYQAMRYPLFPDIQFEIISQNSPMTAKMISKKYLEKTRQDWEQVKVKVMRWCLEVKLCQNWEKFSSLLNETGHKSIVEYSAKDSFWGALKTEDKNKLSGLNALGRLLMDLRERYVISDKELKKVIPLNVTGFLLYGHQIEIVYNDFVYSDDSTLV